MAVAAVGMRGVIVRGMRMLMLAPVGMRPGMRVRVGQGVAVAMQIIAQALVELFLRHWVLRLRGRYGVAEVGPLARRQTGRCAHRFRGSCCHLHDADVRAGEPQQQVHPRFWLRLPIVERIRLPRRHLALRGCRGDLGRHRLSPVRPGSKGRSACVAPQGIGQCVKRPAVLDCDHSDRQDSVAR